MTDSRRVPLQALLIILCTWLMASCATPGISGLQYRAPMRAHPVTTETVVRLPVSETWALLLEQLRLHAFDIKKVEKASRLIHVSFSTDRPEHYVDCGIIHRTFQYEKESETYTYPVTSSSSFKVATQWGKPAALPVVGTYDRDTSLEARITVFVAPKKKHTTVTVHTRYTFISRVSGQQDYMNAAGIVVKSRQISEQQSTIAFETGKIGSAIWNGPPHSFEVTCHPTGLLEAEILAMANGHHAGVDSREVLPSRTSS